MVLTRGLISFTRGATRLYSGSRCFSLTSSAAMPVVKKGDSIPSVDLYENNPGNKVNIKELCKSGKYIIFGVPGAFTPGCSQTHLPGYVERAGEFKAKGVKEIVCVAVNDPFVMGEWGKAKNTEGKVRMLADTNGELAKALDVEIDLTGPLGNVRCKRSSTMECKFPRVHKEGIFNLVNIKYRFALVVEDGVVTDAKIEPDGTGLTCSLAKEVIAQV